VRAFLFSKESTAAVVLRLRRAALLPALAVQALAPIILTSSIAGAQEATPPPDPGQQPPASPPAPTAPQPAPSVPQPAPSEQPRATPESASNAREIEALRAEVKALRADVEATKAAQKAPPPPPPPPPPRPLGYEPFWPWATPPEGISFSAYAQGQYETHQDSQDQLAQGGAVLNQDRFSIRRARANVTGEWQYVAMALELDANTTSGPQVDLRKAELSLQYRPDRARPPIIMATIGQFDTPFGYELVESPRTRFFMERSTLSRAFWPGEPDLGFRLAGALAFFRWTIAGLNGEPLGEKSPFALQDPNAAKDVLFRFGFDSTPRDDLQMAGGVSAIRGRGFHAGTDATSSSVQWIDENGDLLVQQNELQPVLAQGAKPSQSFDRWAVNLDLRANFRWALGDLKVYGEFTVGTNMDRGLFIADPTITNVDQRELGYYFGFTQEILKYGVVGFRYDFYDPNSDAFDTRAGRLIPQSEAFTTYSPLVGLVLPDRARFVLQYDINKNSLARSPVGVPTNLQSNVWTARLQVQL
jgi:hypothetical protein